MTRLFTTLMMVVALLCVLPIPALAGTSYNPLPAPPYKEARGTNDAAMLEAGSVDNYVDKHGMCRWADNNGASTVFVPFRTGTEWSAFISNKPNGVVLDNCCPPIDVYLEATDGQREYFNLGYGRDRAGHARASVTVAHTFDLSREDCVPDGMGGQVCTTTTWQESYSQTYGCAGGSWQPGVVSGGPSEPETACEADETTSGTACRKSYAMPNCDARSGYNTYCDWGHKTDGISSHAGATAEWFCKLRGYTSAVGFGNEGSWGCSSCWFQEAEHPNPGCESGWANQLGLCVTAYKNCHGCIKMTNITCSREATTPRNPVNNNQ